MEIYETAKKRRGVTPLETRMLIQVKVVIVSDRYLRQILPYEAKQTKFNCSRKHTSSKARTLRMRRMNRN